MIFCPRSPEQSPRVPSEGVLRTSLVVPMPDCGPQVTPAEKLGYMYILGYMYKNWAICGVVTLRKHIIIQDISGFLSEVASSLTGHEETARQMAKETRKTVQKED
jgi:hypothetical protein